MLKPDRNDWLGLGTILLLGLGLRLWGLNSTLWYDEINTLVYFTRPSFAELLTEYPSLNHHVFYSLLAKSSILVLGETPFALRLPAAVMGLASIGVLWGLIWEIGRHAKEGGAPVRWLAHFSAFFVATAYHHVWFSQNARGYTGIILFSLLAIFFYLRVQRSAPGWNGLWMSLSLALGLYTHLSAAFLFGAFGLAYLLWLAGRLLSKSSPSTLAKDLRPLWAFIGGVVGALAFLSPLLPDVVATFTSVSETSDVDAVKTGAIAHWKNPLWMVKEIATSLSDSGPLMIVAGLGICAVVGGGILSQIKRGAWLLPAIILIHLPLTIVLLKLGSMRVWPRYFLIDLPFLCFFLVEGAFFYGAIVAKWVTPLASIFKGPKGLGLTFAILGILASAALLPKNYQMPKQPYVAARDWVEAQREPDSIVATIGMAATSYQLYYAPDWSPTETLEELKTLENGYREVWFVYAFPSVTEGRYPDIFQYLEASWVEAQTFDGSLGDGDVVIWKSPTR